MSACDNSILWVTLRTDPAAEEPHFYVTSSLIGPAHSQTGPYAQLSADKPMLVKRRAALTFLTEPTRMSLLPDRQYCGFRMRRECQERFPRHHG